jgi:hypothetical protein
MDGIYGALFWERPCKLVGCYQEHRIEMPVPALESVGSETGRSGAAKTRCRYGRYVHD